MEFVEVKKGNEIKKVEKEIVNQYIASGWEVNKGESKVADTPKTSYSSTAYPTNR